MVTVTGDFAKLRACVEKMGEMAGGLFGNSFLGQLKGVLAVRVFVLIDQGFTQRKSPYGLPWKASKRPGAGDLIDTGRLRGSLTIKATREGVSVASSSPYAAVHQYGTTGKRRIPARPYLPNRDVWPAFWAKGFEEDCLLAVERLWEGV